MTSDSSDSNKGVFSIRKYVLRLISKSRNISPSGNNNSSLDTSALKNLEASKQEMIKGVISLSSSIAREIMIPRIDIVALEVNTDLKDMINTICEAGHSRIPVYDEAIDKIIGTIYAKDLLKFILEKPRKFLLKKLLHKPYFIPETMPLDDLLVEFKKRKLHLAIVIDEYGGVGGIVTLEDILEEIVGEIVDEFDDYKLPEVQKTGVNTFDVDSRITIADLNEETGLNLPTDEFDTIGGLIFDLFGKIPKKNETVEYKSLVFKIKDIKGTRISRIIINKSGKKEKP